MARKNAAQKALAAAKAEAEKANAPAQDNEGGDIDEPPAKKSKKQQHRKDKRESHVSRAAGVRMQLSWPAWALSRRWRNSSDSLS